MAGLTSEGVEVKNYREIISDAQGRLDDNDTGIVITDESNKIANNLANTFTLSLAELWEFGQQVYNSFNIYKAEGNSLDKLVAFKRLIRYPAEYSKGYVEIFSTGNTSINTSTTVRDTRGNTLTALESTTIGTSLFRKVQLQVVTANSGLYVITLGGMDYPYTATNIDTVETIASELAAIIDSVTSYNAYNVDGNIFIEKVASANVIVSYTSQMTRKDFSTLVMFKNSVTGATFIEDNTVTELATTLSSVTSINNPETFQYGRAQETDTELRERFLNSPASSEKATINSIIRGVESVDGVTNVNLINNPTEDISPDSVPRKSYELIVTGGNDLAVATEILDVGAAGIQPYGSILQTIKDSKGTPHTIGFSRPTSNYIFFNVTYEIYDEEVLSENIEALIRESIVTYGQDFIANVDVIPSRFVVPIYQNSSGLGEVLVECGYSTDENAVAPDTGYSVNKISISVREVAVVEAQRINITEV